jgi:hypothetical protein
MAAVSTLVRRADESFSKREWLRMSRSLPARQESPVSPMPARS